MVKVLPSSYIIGIIIFTLFIVGGVSVLGIFQQSDPTFAAGEKYSKFNESFNKLNDVTEEVTDIQDSIENTQSDYGAFGVLNSLISSAWQSLRLLASSFSFMDSAFSGMTMFGMPGWIPALIILVVIVMISFAVFAAIFQREL